MSDQDIRWIQRLNHFNKALSQLKEAVDLSKQRQLSKLEEQGLIQAFEFTYELAWNTLKDYFESQAETGLYGSRDVFRLAFKRGLIDEGETWMDMIRSRNLTTHTYNEDVAKQIVFDITTRYWAEFEKLQTKLEVFEGHARMTFRFGLKESTIQKICAVLAYYPQVEQAILYGSRAKGNYKNGSDIDLTLRGGDDLTLNILYKLMTEIDDLLLPYTIDLSIYAHITDPDVIAHVQRVGVTFYKREEAVLASSIQSA